MRYTIPLLKDNHNHAFTYAALRDAPSLAGVDVKREALEIIGMGCGPVNIVLGWDDSKYHFDRGELSDLPPSIICNLSLHRYVINLPAREMFKERYRDIVENIDDQVWVEKNLIRVITFVAGLKEVDEGSIASFFRMLEGVGVWYAEDMLVSDPRMIRLYAASKYRDRTAVWTDIDTYRTLPIDLQKEVKGIKVFFDGAVEARTAAISANYSEGGDGLLLFSDGEALDLFSSVAGAGKPVAIHAIGDRAIDQSARILVKLRCGGCDLQARIEHCQFISRDAAVKLKDSGAVLSMQPNFTDDSVRYLDRLPRNFLELNNPFRMLIDDAGFKPGEDLIFGSDGMPHGAAFALQQSLFPPYGGQRLTMDEFVAGYCMPDEKCGRIEIDIDETNKSVKIESVSVSR